MACLDFGGPGGGLLIPWPTRYDKTKHDFYFVESSQSPIGREDKWEQFLFVIRRSFGSETPKSRSDAIGTNHRPIGVRLAKQIPENLR